jgi:hypothetical protein
MKGMKGKLALRQDEDRILALHVPIHASLTVIIVAVGGSIVASLWLTRGRPMPARPREPHLRPESEAE